MIEINPPCRSFKLNFISRHFTLRMQLFVITAALLHIGLCDHVAVKMPYLNPSGVTYVNDFHAQEAPLAYISTAPLQTVATHLQYASPATSAKIETHHVGYANAQIPAVAAVPFLKHVSTISQVPITTIEAQPGLLQKQVDVVKPAVTTRKIEVGISRMWLKIKHDEKHNNV